MAQFRFQDLEIWQMAIEIAMKLFDIADELEERKLFRFAEQLRGAGMSISNNIAEGSGSFSDKDFAHFLNMARRSVFKNANILILLRMIGLVPADTVDNKLTQLELLSRKIVSFRNTLSAPA